MNYSIALAIIRVVLPVRSISIMMFLTVYPYASGREPLLPLGHRSNKNRTFRSAISGHKNYLYLEKHTCYPNGHKTCCEPHAAANATNLTLPRNLSLNQRQQRIR